MPALLILLGYLAGCIPSAGLVGRRAGFDPSSAGSGNPGATNALRLGGRRAGATVLLLDVVKGAAPAALGLGVGGTELAVLVGAAAVAGHVLRLPGGPAGGKGVATAAGMAVVAVPAASAAALGAFLVAVLALRTVSLGSIAAAAALPVAAALTGGSPTTVAVLGVVAVLVVVRHRGNLARVRQGTEPQVGVRATH